MKTGISNKISIMFLLLAIGMILFFTFQNPYSSYELSMSIRNWLSDYGLNIEYRSLRTNAHIVEYFILGLAMALFVKNRGWNTIIAVMAGCMCGVLDEMVKILLPGREFGTGDLVRDFIGVGLAVVMIEFFYKIDFM